jgi:hypothetical protein
MEPQGNTKQFIQDLQRQYGRTLSFPEEVGLLIDQTCEEDLGQLFRDAIFHAKFATKTKEVMNRIGAGGEGFDKLSAEFQTSIEKASTLLKTIVKESPDEIKQHFVRDFFSLDQASFARFMKLLEDLSWIKNWEVDGKPLPVTGRPLKSSRQSQDQHPPVNVVTSESGEELAKIRNGAVFALALMILLFVIDPPVILLGWGLAIVVVLLLLYISLASSMLVKKSQTSL